MAALIGMEESTRNRSRALILSKKPIDIGIEIRSSSPSLRASRIALNCLRAFVCTWDPRSFESTAPTLNSTPSAPGTASRDDHDGGGRGRQNQLLVDPAHAEHGHDVQLRLARRLHGGGRAAVRAPPDAVPTPGSETAVHHGADGVAGAGRCVVWCCVVVGMGGVLLSGAFVALDLRLGLSRRDLD